MLSELFHWWLGQLKSLIPTQLKARFRQELCLLYMALEQDTVSIHANFRGETHQFGDIPLLDDNEVRQHELRYFLQQLPRCPDRILVQIAPGRYLSREVELPLAAEQNLSETLRYQLEQLTPFPADQVLYFCGINERLPAQKKLRAWLSVTPSEPVDDALSLLDGTPPTPERMPTQAPANGAPLEIVFRPFGQTDRANFRSTFLLGTALLLLVAGVTTLHVSNRIETRDHLQQQLTQVRVEAREADLLKQAIDQVHEQTQTLELRKSQWPRVLPIWHDVTQRLDDDTWLKRMDLRDGQLTLQGLSANASSLIETLEASPHLRDVRFASSVTRDRSSESDNFNINALIAGLDDGEQP